MQTRCNNLRPTVRRRPASAGVLSLLVALLFAFASLSGVLHQHPQPATSGIAQAQTANLSCCADADHLHPALWATDAGSSDEDCSLCAFVQLPSAPATNVSVVSLPVLTDAPAPTERGVVFFAARFCDRSAARAPPVA